MPTPDILDFHELEPWLDAMRVWLRDDPAAPTWAAAADLARISAGHLHNLLHRRRPVRARHVSVLARAFGLDLVQQERLARLLRGEVTARAPTVSASSLDAARAAALAADRAILRALAAGACATHAFVWALDDAGAQEVYEAGVAAALTETFVQPQQEVIVLLRAFPVSVVLADAPKGAEKGESGPLTTIPGGATVNFNVNAPEANAAEPDILDFLDYRDFLDAWRTRPRGTRRGLSYAALGRRVGVTAGHMRNVIGRRRSLALDLVPSAAARLGLQGDRARYLSLLVSYNDSRDASSALFARREINLIRARFGRAVGQEASSPLLMRWALPVILELSTRPEWREDPAWIAQTLRPALSEAEAADALCLLRAAGFLQGGPADPGAVVYTPAWLPDAAVRQFHDECLDVARDAAALGLEPWRAARLCVQASSPEAVVARWTEAVERAATSRPPASGPRVHLFLAQAFPAGLDLPP